MTTAESDSPDGANQISPVSLTVITEVLRAIIRANPVLHAATEQARLDEALKALLGLSPRRGRKVSDDRAARVAMAEEAMCRLVADTDVTITELARGATHLTSGNSEEAIVARLRTSFVLHQDEILYDMISNGGAEASAGRQLVLEILDKLALAGINSTPPDKFNSPVISLASE